MVRWRYCVILLALLFVTKIQATDENDQEDESEYDAEGNGDDGDDNDDGEDEDTTPSMHRQRHIVLSSKTNSVSRTTMKSPLECYQCVYKSDMSIRACLDPTVYKAHVATCENVDDKCFTSIINKTKSYDAIVRGCRSNCVDSEEVKCCASFRCNNETFTRPAISFRAINKLEGHNCSKNLCPSVMMFITILLILQTNAKVVFF